MISNFPDLIASAIRVPDRREIWEWAREHVDFASSTAFKGKYDVANTPWIREFLRAWKNPYVRVVTFIAPPQESGKTIGAEIGLAHTACTDPRPMAYNITTNTKAEVWSETRFERLIKATPALRERFSRNRHLKKKRRVIFADGTFLLIQGAEVEGNRAGDSVELQVNDECALWPRPQIKEMIDRTLAYRDTRKVIIISTGGLVGSELHEHHLAGNQLEWHHRCPQCQRPFLYIHNPRDPRCNLRYDLGTAVLHADGRLDLREFAKTVHAFCPHPACGHKMFYDRERLAWMNDLSRAFYLPQNPDANPAIVSLRVNAFAIGRTPWTEILEPYVRLHIRGGVFAPEVLKEFITKPCAEFWDEKPYFIATELKLAAYKRADILVPRSCQNFDELFRVMSVDNQHGRKGDLPHRKFVCRAFGKPGPDGYARSRLVDAGRINEWADVRKKQIELGVPDPTAAAPGPWVVVDRRHEPTEVDEVCARYKWYGMLGAANSEFIHPADSPFAGLRQLFSEQRAIDVGYGTVESGRQWSLYFLWSSQKVQAIWHQVRAAGLAEVPMDIGSFCPEYVQEINSHHNVTERTREGGEKTINKKISGAIDDLYDCESMLTVVALMAGIYRRD